MNSSMRGTLGKEPALAFYTLPSIMSLPSPGFSPLEGEEENMNRFRLDLEVSDSIVTNS